MKVQSFTLALLCSGAAFLTVSCQKDDAATAVTPQARAAVNALTTGEGAQLATGSLAAGRADCTFQAFTQAVLSGESGELVTPTACGPTLFNAALAPYTIALNQAIAAKPTLAQRQTMVASYNNLATLNQLYAYVDPTTPYFGADGSLTDFAAKHKRNLESFWNMPNEVVLHGQHVSNLGNRDAIAEVYRNFSSQPLTAAETYEVADYVLATQVTPYPIFLTTPRLALDGFATTGATTRVQRVGNLIVIGDGLVQVMTEAGVDRKVTFAGILGHEWAHQVQFNHATWYPGAKTSPEQTRKTELEADVFSSYYLTHKRGATYNWKSAAEFFELFFNIGDCGFTSNGHHGTPNQRLAASRLGWIIAQETMPMGHILSDEDVHAVFIAALQNIIDNKIDGSAAMASLTTPQLKAVYGNIAKHEQELKNILNGQTTPEAVKNL